jgi:signal transduction histidine kinase
MLRNAICTFLKSGKFSADMERQFWTENHERLFLHTRMVSVIFAITATVYNSAKLVFPPFRMPELQCVSITLPPLLSIVVACSLPLIFFSASKWSSKNYHWIVLIAMIYFIGVRMFDLNGVYNCAEKLERAADTPMFRPTQNDFIVFMMYLQVRFVILYVWFIVFFRTPFTQTFWFCVLSIPAIEAVFFVYAREANGPYIGISLFFIVVLALITSLKLEQRERIIFKKNEESRISRQEIALKHAEVEHANSELRRQTTEIEQINRDLKKKNLIIDDANTRLIIHKSQVEELNRELRRSNQGLQEKNEELERKNIQIASMYDELRLQNLEIEVAKENLQSNNNELDEARRRIETAYDAIQRELIDARMRAEKSSRAKTEFLREAMHDLRNPIFAAGNSLSVLKRALASGNQRQQSDVMGNLEALLNFASTLSRDLFTLTGFELREFDNNPRVVDLQAFLIQTTATCESAARDKGIHFELEPVPTSANLVFIDPAGLRRIVLNLLSNAVKYTCTSESRRGKISVHAFRAKGRVYLVIRDNGVGIDSSRQDEIWNYGKDSSTYGTDGEEGTGIGLTLVRAVKEALKINIEMQSKLDDGTQFAIALPIPVGADTYRAAVTEQHMLGVESHNSAGHIAI